MSVEALKSVWMLSGEFLCTCFDAFEQLLKIAKQDNNPWPYLFQSYNVTPCHPPKLSNTRSVMAGIFNTLVNHMNTVWHLPKYLLIIIDKDLLEDAALFDYGCDKNS